MGTSTSRHKSKAYKLNRPVVSAGKSLPPGKPTLKYDPENSDPDTVTIKWDPPAYNGGSKITGYLVEHKRTGSPHWVKASPIKVCHTQLTICGLEPGWRYQFRVSAENEFGLSDPSPLSEPLAVFVHRSAAIAPYFITELHDLVVLENEKVEFTVAFEGVPLPRISWYKDGLEIFSDRCRKISTEGCDSRLLIYEATIADEAEIKCSATNRVGYAVTRAYLKVEAPPSIRLPRQYEDGLLFQKGETIRLKVSVVGQPPPSVAWFLDGVEIASSLRHKTDYIDKMASLKIKNAGRSDRGEYQIRASNVLGEDLASILVTIANRPQAPTNVRVTRMCGPSVSLSWSPPEDDGGCEIGCYIIEYFKTNWDVWLKAMTCRQLRITLDNIIEGSEYKFRVKAENPFGISEPSSETEPVFIPDPKRGIFHLREADFDSDSLIPESVLELQVPQLNPYLNRSTPTRDHLEPGTAANISSYSADSQMETDGSWEHLESRKYSPVKPARKRTKKSEAQIPPLANDRMDFLLIPPEADYYRHQSPSPCSSDRGLTPSPQPSISVDDTSRSSSELMLVLVPDEDSKNSRARCLTRDSDHLLDQLTSQVPPPPISLSAPELGSNMQFFRPLQRNCVSSTEILHESTIARFHKELKEEDAASKFEEKFSLQKSQPFADTFEGPQLQANRLRETREFEELNSQVLTDLRRINMELEDGPLLDETEEFPNYIRRNLESVNSAYPFEIVEALGPSKKQWKSTTTERKLQPPPQLSSTRQIPTQTSSILTVEPHPQGRYSPRSGTFHYPDLFMESLTKSPKFKSTSGSLSEVVAELISKKAAAINSTPGSPEFAPVIREYLLKPNQDPTCSFNCTPIRSPPGDLDFPSEAETYKEEDDEDSEKVESEELEESDEDFDELEDESDTYHPSDCAPLSFEQALAISNPKRSVSPTNDLFLESEASFYEDGEPDYGLHYFNRNYGDEYTESVEASKSFAIRGEEKLLKPILKYSSWEEPHVSTEQSDHPEYPGTAVRRRESRSPKKHVRIEEPEKERKEPVKKEDVDTSLVIINHYSDIVKQYGNVQKPVAKKYMTYEELKAAAQMAECETIDDDLEDPELDDVFLENEESPREPEPVHPCEAAAVLVKPKGETEIVRRRVHFLFHFCIDLFMFAFACWVYCFKDERLAIPVIVLMVYRQLYDKIKNKLPKFEFGGSKK